RIGDIDFETSFGAIDPISVPLPRCGEIAGVGHNRTAAVFDDRAISVLDINGLVVNVTRFLGGILVIIGGSEPIPRQTDHVAVRTEVGGVVVLKIGTILLGLNKVEGLAR